MRGDAEAASKDGRTDGRMGGWIDGWMDGSRGYTTASINLGVGDDALGLDAGDHRLRELEPEIRVLGEGDGEGLGRG